MRTEAYDVVVVGSGLGGMSASALLAHAGYKILVVERLPFLGGRFSTRPYKGFKLTTGAIGVGGLVESIFKEVGAEFDVEATTDVLCHINGEILRLPEKGRLNKQIALVAENDEEARRVSDVIRRAMVWAEPSDSITFRDWLFQYTRNERIHGIFQSFISGFAMLNADEIPANGFFRMAKKSATGGVGVRIARKGNIVLVEALAKVIKDHGGAVWSRSPAKRILVERQEVKGIVVRHQGEEIEISSRAVISNAGPRKTVALTGSEYFDRSYLKKLQEDGNPTSQMWIWFASDTPLFDGVVVTPTACRRLNVITMPTAVCPELAPPGKHLYVAGASPGSSTQPVDYGEELKIALNDVRDVLPGFDRRAEILVAQYYRGDFPGYEAWPHKGMPEKTPVVNLYNVGDGVHVPGGFGTVTAVESARMVVNDLKSRLNLFG